MTTNLCCLLDPWIRANCCKSVFCRLCWTTTETNGLINDDKEWSKDPHHPLMGSVKCLRTKGQVDLEFIL